jgi:uncharacterized protein YecT (DUF1311 family)
MQGAGEGRELSITFQTSGKAVRLGAPEKWRKAVAGEDLKPDTWVEIHRQGGAPQTVRADEVPELHAIFLERGLVTDAPPIEATDEASAPPEPAPTEAVASPADPPAGPSPIGAPSAPGDARRPANLPPPALGASGRRSGGIVVVVVGVLALASVLRACGHSAHRLDTSGLQSGQLSIALDSSAPSSAPAPTGAESAVPAPVEAQGPGPVSAAPEAAAGPSFNCGRVTSDILRLICATPDLAAADRTLAAAYSQALAASADPAALRESERAWVAARNAGPADVEALRAAYAERIQALRDQLAPKSADAF